MNDVGKEDYFFKGFPLWRGMKGQDSVTCFSIDNIMTIKKSSPSIPLRRGKCSINDFCKFPPPKGGSLKNHLTNIYYQSNILREIISDFM